MLALSFAAAAIAAAATCIALCGACQAPSSELHLPLYALAARWQRLFIHSTRWLAVYLRGLGYLFSFLFYLFIYSCFFFLFIFIGPRAFHTFFIFPTQSFVFIFFFFFFACFFLVVVVSFVFWLFHCFVLEQLKFL